MDINRALCCSGTTDLHRSLCGNMDCGITMSSGGSTDPEHPHGPKLSYQPQASPWPQAAVESGTQAWPLVVTDLGITIALGTDHSHQLAPVRNITHRHSLASDGSPDQGHPGFPCYLRPGTSARLSTAVGRQTSTRTLDFNTAWAADYGSEAGISHHHHYHPLPRPPPHACR